MINIQNSDNECFKWWLVRYLHPANRSTKFTNVDKDFERELKSIKFTVKIKDIHKTEKKELHRHWCFWLRKQAKIPNLYVKKHFQKTC